MYILTLKPDVSYSSSLCDGENVTQPHTFSNSNDVSTFLSESFQYYLVPILHLELFDGNAPHRLGQDTGRLARFAVEAHCTVEKCSHGLRLNP